jgi:hypothetical protein
LAKWFLDEKWKESTTGQKVFWVGFVLGFVSTFTGLDRGNVSLFDFPLSGAFTGFWFWGIYRIGKFIKDKISK